MMLQQLPNELLTAILIHLDRRDLKRLSEAAKGLHQVATPLLYETVDFQVDERFSLLPRFFSLLVHSKKYCHLVKNVSFEQLSSVRRVRDCPHKSIYRIDSIGEWRVHDEDTDDSEDSDVDDWSTDSESEDSRSKDAGSEGSEWEDIEPTIYNGVEVLGQMLLPFLEALAENSICRFSWKLRTCVPSVILGPFGYLQKYQNKMKELSLVQDPWCMAREKEGESTMSCLKDFRCLQVFRWSGVESQYDILSFRHYVKANNAHCLESLELRLADYLEVDEDEDEDENEDGSSSEPDSKSLINVFAHKVLELKSGHSRSLFPCLKHLSLSRVSFEFAAKELAHALNLSGLRSLKLLDCPEVSSLLRQATDGDLQIKLESFEIVHDSNHGPLFHLHGFLMCFEGLRDLFLMIPDSCELGKIGEGISCHSKTLKRLVVHGRGSFRGLSTDTELSLQKRDQIFNSAGLALDCLGISDTFSSLGILALEKHAAVPTCRILHLRASRKGDEFFPDVFDDSTHGYAYYSEDADLARDRFANWAFGPRGLPNLEIIASGDFSHSGRYTSHTELLCRSEECASGENPSYGQNYRNLTSEDTRLQELLRSNMDMIGACAVDPVYG